MGSLWESGRAKGGLRFLGAERALSNGDQGEAWPQMISSSEFGILDSTTLSARVVMCSALHVNAIRMCSAHAFYVLCVGLVRVGRWCGEASDAVLRQVHGSGKLSLVKLA